MPARIGVIHRIIIAVRVEVESVWIFWIEICSIIRRDKSTPFGVIISCVEIIEPYLVVVVISSVAYGVDSR